MGFGSRFGVALLCWVLALAASSDPWGFPSRNSGMWRLRGDSPRSQAWARVDLSQLRALSPRPAVAVRCQEGQLAVTVRRDLFGTGRPVRAVELSLGTASCPPLSPNPAQAFVTFVAALHECGSTLQVSGTRVSRAEDTASAFVSPRPRPESLRFLLDAFKFAGDAGNLLYISCHLRVSPAGEAPNSRNKACSFSRASGLWAPLEGTAAICSCCDTGSCPSPGADSREFRAPAARMGRRLRRDGSGQRGGLLGPTEADVSVGPLLILEPAQGLMSPSGSPGAAGNTPQGSGHCGVVSPGLTQGFHKGIFWSNPPELPCGILPKDWLEAGKPMNEC
ncbi:hypothetical protein EK904_005886 [Melospiza melodia maxima]|nr:hypothetical protein EK904_005886 [Melospiza melodia maxima]